MRPVEDTLNLHDLVARVPLSRVDAAVLVYGLDAAFVRTEDIVAIEQQRDESGIDLSPPEQRLARMYFELDRIEISSAIREAAALVATTSKDAHRRACTEYVQPAPAAPRLGWKRGEEHLHHVS